MTLTRNMKRVLIWANLLVIVLLNADECECEANPGHGWSQVTS